MGNDISRKRSEAGGKVLYGIISLFLFLLLFGLTFRSRGASGEKTQAQIVMFGDSVYALVRDETAVSARLQELTGKTTQI